MKTRRDKLTTTIAEAVEAHPSPPRPVSFLTVFAAAYNSKLAIASLFVIVFLVFIIYSPFDGSSEDISAFYRGFLVLFVAIIVLSLPIYIFCLWICLRFGPVVIAHVTNTVFSHYTGTSGGVRGYTIHVSYQVNDQHYVRAVRLNQYETTIPRPGQRLSILLWPKINHIMIIIRIVRTQQPHIVGLESTKRTRRRGQNRSPAG